MLLRRRGASDAITGALISAMNRSVFVRVIGTLGDVCAARKQ
jgi:hypothetical protein